MHKYVQNEQMKRKEKIIIREIKAGRFSLTVHARKRMNERFVSEADIIHVANNLKSIRFQEEKDTFLLAGKSEWGNPLFISAALRNDVIIVTVFFEDDYENNND